MECGTATKVQNGTFSNKNIKETQFQIHGIDDSYLPDIPATLSVQVPSDRDYAPVLAQTEVVYDQLLSERYHKLINLIKERDREFNTKYADLYNSGEKQKAEEFKRWSDTALIQFKHHSAQDLQALRQDYEAKYMELWRNLEAQWQTRLHTHD